MHGDISLLQGAIVAAAFLAEYVDSSLGMGYGTTLTPLLLAAGFSPLQTVPSILLSEFLTGIMASVLHHRAGNVLFDFKNDAESKAKKRFGALGYVPKSMDSKVASLLAVCSIVGTVVAVFVAVSLSKFYLKLYIGLLVLSMGLLILVRRRTRSRFSWGRVFGLGMLASFNKGMSGGGYGPLVTSGQILSGVNAKSAIGITSFAEGLTCLVGIIAYLFTNESIDWSLASFLVIGALLSVPFSVRTVKAIDTDRIILLVGGVTLVLGLYTIITLFI